MGFCCGLYCLVTLTFPHHVPDLLSSNLQDGAAVTGLAIAGASLMAVHYTGNPIFDPIGSIVVGNLLGMVSKTSQEIARCWIALIH